MPSTLERAIARNRAALLADEAAAQARLATAYQAARRRLERRIQGLAPALADEPSPGRVFADARYRALLGQVDEELRRLGAQAAGETAALQRSFVEAAGAHGRELVGVQRPGLAASFATLPRSATEDLVGMLADGSPLVDSLGQTFGAAASEAESALAAGIASGQGLLDIGRTLLHLTDGLMVGRVMTTARTAPMTAYRVAALRNYEANADLVTGWRWVTALQANTCLACLNRQGSIHPLSEQFFGTHPNCRCTPIPVVKGAAASALESGQAWFDRQLPADQERQMGKAAWAAYRAGEIQFSDFLGEYESERWGPSIYERSLGEIRRGRTGAAAARRAETPVGTNVDFEDEMLARLRVKTPMLPRYRQTFDAIDRVHRDGDLPAVRVLTERSPRPWEGQYDPARQEISVRERGVHPESTLVHEVGHYLDRWAIGGDRGYGSEAAADLAEWRAAVRGSHAYQILAAMQAAGANPALMDYLMSDVELWARSYAQYIAVESGDAALTAQLADALAKQSLPQQWAATDFAPIRGAIRRAFDRMGWSR